MTNQNARVREDSPLSVVRSCGGVDYTRREWTPVPAGREAEAAANPYLEVEAADVAQTDSANAREAEEEKAAEPAPVPTIEAERVVIDARDGISEVEASGAGRALAQRQREGEKPAKTSAKRGKGKG